MVKTTSKTAAAKPAVEIMQAFRATAESGTTRAKEAFEKMSAAATEAADLIKNSYSTATNGVQEYNTKVIGYARKNMEASFAFAQKLSGVNSPSNFVELSIENSRKQFEVLTAQTKELTELAQKIALATAEPIKDGVSKVFSQAA